MIRTLIYKLSNDRVDHSTVEAKVRFYRLMATFSILIVIISIYK